MIRRAFALVTLAALALGGLLVEGWRSPADAASLQMCAPSRAGAALGPARWVAPTSGTTYGLNARGCALISSTDNGDAVAAGFVLDAPHGSVVRSGITTSASGNTLVIPAGAVPVGGIVQETSGGTVSGNLKLGTTNGGTQMFNGTMTIPASTAKILSQAHFAITNYTPSSPTTIYVDTTGQFGTGAVSVTIFYAYY